MVTDLVDIKITMAGEETTITVLPVWINGSEVDYYAIKFYNQIFRIKRVDTWWLDIEGKGSELTMTFGKIIENYSKKKTEG